MHEGPERFINEARNHFEKDLRTAAYARITSDSDQLERILVECGPEAGKTYLDIGTGRGYVAFALAVACPGAEVVRIDIVEKVLLENNREAEIKGFNRLKFQTFSGMTIPFVDTHFDGAIARYSFHHFPDAEAAVREIGRVIKKGGFYFIVDPTPNKRDNVDFINKFSQLRNDGHMRYYEETELNRVFQSEGMIYESTFYSELTIPREMNEGYQTLLDGTPRNVRESYKLKVKDDKMEVTVRVMNVLFRK